MVDAEEVTKEDLDGREDDTEGLDADAVVSLNATSEVEPKEEEEEVPTPLRGTKVAIITGASTGIGFATAEGLARSEQYGTIIMAGRDGAKHEAAIASLQRRLGKKADDIEFRHMPVNLDSLQSVRDFVEDFQALDLPLHTLILNAGVMMLPERKVTTDGYEYQFGVNHLSHFLLTNMLLDEMAKVATVSDPGRVISLSSVAHVTPTPLLKGSFKDLQSVRYSPVGAYGQSKLANLLFAYELDRRCRAKGIPITANAVHPGGVDTELPRYIAGEGSLFGSLQKMIGQNMPKLPFLKTPEDGAKTSILLATTDYGKMSGRYWQDEKPSASIDVKAGRTRLTSYDPEVWSKLWEESERLVDLSDDETPAILME